jgi:hypothetical protein
MKDDTREELERIEKELLSAEPVEDTMVIHMPLEEELPEEESLEDLLNDTMVQDILSRPGFEDAEQVRDAQEPEIFCNFSNGYGRDLKQTEEESPESAKAKSDRIDIGLMIASSALCLGIIGIMIYWCVRFLG